MSGKTLVALASVWLALAILAFRFGPDMLVGVHVNGRGAVSTFEAVIAAGALVSACVIFLIGWIVPLGIGIFRLIRDC